MRLVSWNVNGIRAILRKNFAESFQQLSPDILCLQETKAQPEQVAACVDHLDDFHLYTSSADKKGYSGTAILSRYAATEVRYGIGQPEHDGEGRVIALRFPGCWVLTVYTPNSGSELKRLPYRTTWDAAFLDYLRVLETEAPVIVCGDLNVAHRPIDLARPRENYNKAAGYMQAEIDGMDKLAEAGFVDTFRSLHPDTIRYSWWSYRAGARARNVGWRIDYFLVSEKLRSCLTGATIETDIIGSDHCPVTLDLQPALIAGEAEAS